MFEVEGRPFPSIRFHEPSRHPDNGGTRGDILYDHRSRADFRTFPNGNGTEDGAIGADHDPAFQGGMALLLLQGGPAKDDSLIDQTIVFNLGRFTDYYSHSVIDEEATSDGRPGMDLDSR